MSDELPELVEGVHLGDNPGMPSGDPSLPPYDLSTFAGRAAAVAAQGGCLVEHLCCPKCGCQETQTHGNEALCPRCEWAGLVVELIDTVLSGATRI